MLKIKKPLMAAAVSMALGLGMAASVQAGPVLFDTHDADGVLAIGGFDWSPTTFLAKGANSAILAFIGSSGACPGTICQFDVLAQAKVSDYLDINGDPINGLAGKNVRYELTMLANFKEKVASLNTATNTAGFATVTGTPGIFEMYYDRNAAGTAPNTVGNNLTGFGFNDGRLILTGTKVGDASGTFTVTGTTPVNLDANGNGNQYNGTGVDPDGTGPALDPDNQFTLAGSGTNGAIPVTNIIQDNTFFLNAINNLGLNFQNISQSLPFGTPDPMDCLTQTPLNLIVGTTNAAYACNTTHIAGPYAAQAPGDANGYVPVTGAVNALLFSTVPGASGADFVAQTDFNSTLASDVPEPASLALLGLGLGLLGFGARRRKRIV